MDNLIEQNNWYQKLINDLRILNSEGIVKTKHSIGKRILEDELKFQRAEYGNRTVENLAEDLDIHASDLYRCIQFARNYPELSDNVRELSWRRIKHKLLPDKPHVSRATGENEWFTPPEYIEAAKNVMGRIDLDPASSKEANKIIQAENFYSEDENGLKHEWWGNIWMNPPYSQPLIAQFCNLLVEKYKSNEIKQACVLINNATETNFYQNMLSACHAVCFIRGRVKFIDKKGNPSGAPLQGQTILYFGSSGEEFKKAFLSFGRILWKKEEK